MTVTRIGRFILSCIGLPTLQATNYECIDPTVASTLLTRRRHFLGSFLRRALYSTSGRAWYCYHGWRVKLCSGVSWHRSVSAFNDKMASGQVPTSGEGWVHPGMGFVHRRRRLKAQMWKNWRPVIPAMFCMEGLVNYALINDGRRGGRRVMTGRAEEEGGEREGEG